MFGRILLLLWMRRYFLFSTISLILRLKMVWHIDQWIRWFKDTAANNSPVLSCVESCQRSGTPQSDSLSRSEKRIKLKDQLNVRKFYDFVFCDTDKAFGINPKNIRNSKQFTFCLSNFSYLPQTWWIDPRFCPTSIHVHTPEQSIFIHKC